MQRHPVLTIVLTLLLALAVAACGGNSPEMREVATGSAATGTPASTQVLTRNTISQPVALQATPAQESTPEHALISVWWPDELYPANETLAADIFESQIDLFQITYASYDIDVRHKRTNGLGGILPTLRTAGPVAPSALPDLTLMRRTDIITAAKEGLIVPLDEWVPADLAGSNLFVGTRALGEVDGALYGIPYALTMQHTVYRQSIFAEPPTTFDRVLSTETPFLFRAGESPVSWTVLLQYIEAGGHLVDESGIAVLTPDALIAVLDYYAAGAQMGIFSPLLLDYTTSTDYWNALVTGEASIATVSSNDYLTMKDTVQNIGLSSIPTGDGAPLTVVDGWMWVITTQNPDRQQRALAFLVWMMRISQQSALTEALGMLPSQTRALRLWDDEVYADFAESLMSTAFVLPEDRRNNAAANALQDAVASVLRGTSPEMAADNALTRMGQ